MSKTKITAYKRQLYKGLYDLAASAPGSLKRRLGALYHDQARWRGSHPLNEIDGRDAIEAKIWRPLLRSCPDLERRDLIFCGGSHEGRDYIAAMGHYCGTFRKDWLTIPATGRPIYLRYGEVHQIEDGKIVESTCLWDLLDLIRQAGFWPIAPSLGTEGMWPGPITSGGLVLEAQDEAVSAASIKQTLAMHKTLADYDDNEGLGRDGLLVMPQIEHWHPKMMWYGPSGIGTTRGLQGFVDYHQLPFRIAFPNRKGGEQIADREKGGHYIQIGDGNYSVTGGWPSVRAMHVGGDFLGTGPTGREVTMRVMDFYLHHEGLIRENWVPIDIIELLLQMGVDVFSRMHSLFERGALPK
ncbi:MAG: ester cyclase [Alphaproteobacteria bacterium]|nr:ester cyclase [Alphaproteobacteria bacterium]